LADMEVFSRVVESDDDAAIMSMVDALSGFPLVKTEEASESAPKMQKPMRTFFLCLAAIVALVVVSTLSAFAGMKFESDPVVPGDFETFLAPNHRREQLVSLILEWGLTSRSRLEDGSSPAASALNWLVEVDTSTDREDVRTRFALATLYYGTQSASAGFSWSRSNHWLSKYPVCLWYGVYCHEEEITVGRVRGLNLSSNGLIHTLPDEIGMLDLDIYSLDLSHNALSGSMPESISRLRNLKDLYLGPNLFSATLPSSFGQLVNLVHLFVNDCLLTGRIPYELTNFTNLQALGLHENTLSGKIPRDLHLMTALAVLYLDDNALTGSIPASIPQSLIDLRLRQNQLSGTIPRIGDLEILQTLYIDSNRLTGSIPAELGGLRLLHEFHAYQNDLTGSPIPSSFGNLGFLRILYVDGNRLEGTLCSELGLMHRLESLFIHENHIEGKLPVSMAMLTRLEYFIAHSNSITGAIPSELGALTSLKKLELHGNDFEGEVPMEICDLTTSLLQDFTTDCAADDVGFVCECCSFCY